MKPGIKKTISIALVSGGLAVSFFTGRYSAIDRDFQVIREGNKTFLHYKPVDISHQLRNTGTGIYLGDARHNAKGAVDLAIHKTRYGPEPESPKRPEVVEGIDNLLSNTGVGKYLERND